MEEERRSGEPSGFIVKNRSSSGCLIVKRKGSDDWGGAGSSGVHKVYQSKKAKKRPRLDFCDSGSSGELLMPLWRRLGPETIRVCGGLSGFDERVVEESDADRKRSKREDVGRNEVMGVIGRNGEDFSKRKRNRLDVFEFDEYEGNDGEMIRRNRFGDDGMEGRKACGSIMVGSSSTWREYETGLSRHSVADRKKDLYFERTRGLSQGDHCDRDAAQLPISFLRDMYDSDEPIRVQGKNGVLKVKVNKKKKKVVGSLSSYDHLENEENRKGLGAEDTVKQNVLIRPPVYCESIHVEQNGTFIGKEKHAMNSMRSLPTRNCKVQEQNTEDSEISLKMGTKKVDVLRSMKMPSTKKGQGHNMDSEDSDASLNLGSKSVDAHKSLKGAGSKIEKTPSNQIPPAKAKEGKVRRGTGTEKQQLRERIRGMLQDAGWTIDYRPRRNRDYLDAVYISPTGTAYWSIIKAYDALLKQLNDKEDDAKYRANGSPFAPLPNDVLGQLTRKTCKKMEKEIKRKQRGSNKNEITIKKTLTTRFDEESMDSGSHEEKLSSFAKQGKKSVKGRANGHSSFSVNSKGQSSIQNFDDRIEKPFSGFNSHQGRKSGKLGRCTLLVRNSNQGLNSESDGFVPYAGKLTLLYWLIDTGTVQSSQKVRYMNRRQTKVMLEGWVTKDGIHCGCCSKILTVSKFEIHAGSKLRQPFQNIYLDSGVSLLECQIEAWNRQESVERIGFHSIDIDGDDPNDDTCAICGDGGDLICCDGCPSTFHQSCLDIKMLPPGDWHCPNCTCKFCGTASEKVVEEDDTIFSMLLTCSLCAKRYHKSCMQEMDAPSLEADSFCGNKCRELFEQLQRYLGVKHELEAGYSWSLIHRTDAVSDVCIQGLPQRVECNSKLAVALSVMDECFLPIVDRRSGINLIHNVLYNSGSNFNRLNFSGFCTAILERGDEMISAASIRFHGTQLAEMPFIGTRHMYRRQGMCHRLFYALQTVLCSMKVEKLIIPAISELTHTWTEVFGFTALGESLKQELKSINILVFPGIEMLQKQISELENFDEDMTSSRGAKRMESKDSPCNVPDVANKPHMVSSAGFDPHECENDSLECPSEMNDVDDTNAGSQHPGVSLNNASAVSNSLYASHELRSTASLNEDGDSESGNKIDKYDLEKKSMFVYDARNDICKIENKAKRESPFADDSIQADMTIMDSDLPCACVSSEDASLIIGSSDASHELKNTVPLEGTTCAGFESRYKLSESAPNSKCFVAPDIVESDGRNSAESYKESNVDDAYKLNPYEFGSGELKTAVLVEETNSADSLLDNKAAKQSSKHSGDDSDHMEIVPVLDFTVPNNGQPCSNYYVGEDHKRHNVECIQANPSTEEPAAESPANQINEILYESENSFNVADQDSGSNELGIKE